MAGLMDITFQFDKLLRVKIRQEPKGRPAEKPSVQFLKWCLDNNVIPARGGGGGPHGGTYYFYWEDAKKVRKYLRDQGWEELEESD